MSTTSCGWPIRTWTSSRGRPSSTTAPWRSGCTSGPSSATSRAATSRRRPARSRSSARCSCRTRGRSCRWSTRRSTPRPARRLPEFVTVHEVGPNGFQGVLASNEPDEAWLDEGVNEWADVRAMNELYGQRGSLVDWMGWQASVGGALRAADGATGDVPSPIATASYAFVDNAAYNEQTYVATCLL